MGAQRDLVSSLTAALVAVPMRPHTFEEKIQGKENFWRDRMPKIAHVKGFTQGFQAFTIIQLLFSGRLRVPSVFSFLLERARYVTRIMAAIQKGMGAAGTSPEGCEMFPLSLLKLRAFIIINHKWYIHINKPHVWR